MHCSRVDCCLLRFEIKSIDHDASFACASSDCDTGVCKNGARIAVTQQ